ncbi:unnamed protein product [Vitrella brassicaformis CCMP3155]|uniref:CN hydrolase domain-containing protein n=2 Tax=Vitrella brassicaformis TaxID=1169539 RepID=A0A0G4EGZ7_VITBC|nr:unnamed protein product [Vitrella brassicaformis CCMP3155]|mmetsp:Transcript_34033/g.84142  ORF Transcript_34033/g.84142 Transcript_34033/m.84142 type:complete len:301 (+) Transcript_34033:105-1007(+)|eukprot:CEL95739.1 unnamed protein product [Vitrella brassicaformis CCMP3155]
MGSEGGVTKFGLLLCQTPPVPSKKGVAEAKTDALEAAKKLVGEGIAAHPGAKMVVLPEMFACPYGTKFFEPFCEPVPDAQAAEPNTDQSPSVKVLVDIAKSHGVWLVGGSVSERDSAGKIYNTCLVFNPQGHIVAKHRKVHLFDIDIPGKMTFKESETLSAGGQVTTFESPFGTIGVGICYDVRFAELALSMRQRGAQVLIYPGAFNTTTGPAHWRILCQGRALDTQCYVAVCSPARSEDAGDYPAWGHSLVVDPWGEVKVELDEKPGFAFVDVDLDYLKDVRTRVPISMQKRPELYELK